MNKENAVEKARKARNAYLREWRRKNPEKVRAIQQRYWEKKALKKGKDESGDIDENS